MIGHDAWPRVFAALLLGLLASWCGAAPNIVVIVADDLGTGDVGAYGESMVRTPHIDALAREGFHALDAHGQATCVPARYALQTGTDFWRLGQNPSVTHEAWIAKGQPTIASVLRDAGYATALIGKWHLGFTRTRGEPDWNAPLSAGVLSAGYDYFFGMPNSIGGQPLVYVRNRTVVGLDPHDPIVVHRDPIGEGGTMTGGTLAQAQRVTEEVDLHLAAEAVRWMRHHHDKPFFLVVTFSGPHSPYVPHTGTNPRWPVFAGSSAVGAYGDVVQQMDYSAGRVLAAIDSLGVRDNTLVIFTSDNGAILQHEVLARGHWPNRSLLGQKTDAWEGGHRVPFIARWPGRIPQGSSAEGLISLADVAATVWAAAGVVRPAGAGPDSFNQLPLLKGTGTSRRTEMVYHAMFGFALRSGPWVFQPTQGSYGFSTIGSTGWGASAAIVRIGDAGWRLSDYDAAGALLADAPAVQLYDLRRRRGEFVNLAANHPATVQRLRARLDALLLQREAP